MFKVYVKIIIISLFYCLSIITVSPEDFLTAIKNNNKSFVLQGLATPEIANNQALKNSALHSATYYGYIELVNALLNSGAQLMSHDSSSGNTVLHWSIGPGTNAQKLAIFVNLLERYNTLKGLDPSAAAFINARNNSGNTPLHLAILNKNEDAAKMLINSGADVGIKNNEDLDPYGLSNKNNPQMAYLFAPASSSTSKLVVDPKDFLTAIKKNNKLFVLQALATPEIANNQALKNTALHNAVYYGYIELVNAVLNSGAQLTYSNPSNGNTVLHMAIGPRTNAQKLQVLANLLERYNILKEVNPSAATFINARNKSGNTPLHVAILNKNDDAARMLINSGADTSIKSNEGLDAYAFSNKYSPQMAYLFSPASSSSSQSAPEPTVDPYAALAIAKNATSHQILGVAPDASQEDIKKAFHKLSLKWHPDRNPDPVATEVFQLIAGAYAKLTDTTRAPAQKRHAPTGDTKEPAQKKPAPSTPTSTPEPKSSMPYGSIEDLIKLGYKFDLLDIPGPNKAKKLLIKGRNITSLQGIEQIIQIYRSQGRIGLKTPITLSINQTEVTRLEINTFFKWPINVTRIEFDNNPISSIEPGAFSEVPSLQDLSFSNSLQNIILKENMFSGLQKLAFLQIVSNKNIKLDKDLLRAMTNLKEFFLINNDLTELPEDFFQYTPYLADIDLKYNKFTQLPKNLFAKLRYLRRLDLTGNPLFHQTKNNFRETHTIPKGVIIKL